jgi:hypothetical protein
MEPLEHLVAILDTANALYLSQRHLLPGDADELAVFSSVFCGHNFHMHPEVM